MLLDTSGLLCCFDVDEVRHDEEVKLYGDASLRLTHNYVLAELVALAQARRLSREASLSFAAQILTDAEVEVVWVDPVLHNEAMQLLQMQLDKQSIVGRCSMASSPLASSRSQCRPSRRENRSICGWS